MTYEVVKGLVGIPKRELKESVETPKNVFKVAESRKGS